MNVNKKPKKVAIGTVVYISVLLIFDFLFVALAYLVFDIKNSYDAKMIFTSLSLISFIISLFVSNFIYHQILQKLNLEELSKFYYGAKTYGETNKKRMNWFSFYIKVLLPLRIPFSILSFISLLGNMHSRYVVTGVSPWTNVLILSMIINIVQFFVLCYTYTKMKNLESESYNSNIVYMMIGLLSISFTYLYSLNVYGILSLIPIIIYLLIWFIPNYFYFKKRKSIFGFDYTSSANKSENSSFDIFWICPNCGRQNQSVKCFGCGLTKEEALNTINSEKTKQNESIPLNKIERETETSFINAEELLNNEKIEELWSGIKPETADKMFKMGKEQISNIIISLSQILNINLKDCDIAQYKNILNIYGKTFIWKTEKKASYESIILSLQKYNKYYISSEEIAKKVFDFCVSDIYITDYKSKSDKITPNLKETQNLKLENNEFSFCNICGNKLDNDYAFCNKCGNKVR